MIFHVTEIRNYKRCRRMWDYSSFSRQGLTRRVAKPHFALGTLVHKTLELWANNPNLDPITEYAVLAGQEVEHITDAYTKTVGAKPSKVELNDTFAALDLGAGMIGNYQVHWKTPLPATHALVATEQTIVVDIPGTNHKLEGQLDGIIQNISTGKVQILERKTYEKRPNLTTLERDFQFICYLYLANRIGINTLEIAYDGLWKRPYPPKNTKLPDLFLRKTINFTQYELEEVEQQLVNLLEEMGNPNTNIYHNVPWNGCWDCSYTDLCKEQSTGQPLSLHNYVLRDRTVAFEEVS